MRSAATPATCPASFDLAGALPFITITLDWSALLKDLASLDAIILSYLSWNALVSARGTSRKNTSWLSARTSSTVGLLTLLDCFLSPGFAVSACAGSVGVASAIRLSSSEIASKLSRWILFKVVSVRTSALLSMATVSIVSATLFWSLFKYQMLPIPNASNTEAAMDRFLYKLIGLTFVG